MFYMDTYFIKIIMKFFHWHFVSRSEVHFKCIDIEKSKYAFRSTQYDHHFQLKTKTPANLCAYNLHFDKQNNVQWRVAAAGLSIAFKLNKIPKIFIKTTAKQWDEYMMKITKEQTIQTGQICSNRTTNYRKFKWTK